MIAPDRVSKRLIANYLHSPTRYFSWVAVIGWFVDADYKVKSVLYDEPSQRSKTKKFVKLGWRYVKAMQPVWVTDAVGYVLSEEVRDGKVAIECNFKKDLQP
jgi:hypothetical protein